MSSQIEASISVSRVRRIANEVARPMADDVDRAARFPHEAMQALRVDGWLAAYIPQDLGGSGCSVSELATMCRVLGEACGATALIFAMHHIQVGCLVRHGHSAFLRDYLRRLVDEQLLIGSVTSEVGVGGDLRSSIACITPEEDGRYRLEKASPTISYGEFADALLVTARRSPTSAAGDQVLVLLRAADFSLTQTGVWDTLGMRGTCSPGFRLSGTCTLDQVMDVPFAEIASESMVPLSHILWSACWLGIATAAVARARAFVRAEAKPQRGVLPTSAVRLAEVATLLQTLRSSVAHAATTYEHLLRQPEPMPLSSTILMNNLKLSASRLVVEVVSRALSICGMAGYTLNSPFSLGRHLRDAYSAGLMINNERLLATNAALLLVHKEI